MNSAATATATADLHSDSPTNCTRLPHVTVTVCPIVCHGVMLRESEFIGEQLRWLLLWVSFMNQLETGVHPCRERDQPIPPLPGHPRSCFCHGRDPQELGQRPWLARRDAEPPVSHLSNTWGLRVYGPQFQFFFDFFLSSSILPVKFTKFRPKSQSRRWIFRWTVVYFRAITKKIKICRGKFLYYYKSLILFQLQASVRLGMVHNNTKITI